MRYLEDVEEAEAMNFLKEAAKEAELSTCLRAKCGSVIVKNGEVIARGYNSPPQDDEGQRKCLLKHELGPGFKSDRTCCIHAEIRAIMDGLRNNSNKLPGSRLYFIRINEQDGGMLRSGQPYCTYCSKMSLDAGIAEFVLWHGEGVGVYDTREYNLLSFQYGT